MSDKETKIGDKVIEAQLNNHSYKLNISLDAINRQVCQERIVHYDYYEPPQRTREELIEMGRKAVEKDMKNGFPPKKHNFDVFVGRWNQSDDEYQGISMIFLDTGYFKVLLDPKDVHHNDSLDIMEYIDLFLF